MKSRGRTFEEPDVEVFKSAFDSAEQGVVNKLFDQLEFAYGVIREAHEEKRLRSLYPTLQSAWDNYQLVLKMCRGDDDDH